MTIHFTSGGDTREPDSANFITSRLYDINVSKNRADFKSFVETKVQEK